jgi:hypothetical protein
MARRAVRLEMDDQIMRRAEKFLVIGTAAIVLTSGILLALALRQPTDSPRPAGAVPLSSAPAAPGEALPSPASTPAVRLALTNAPTITVYKTPTCGCCTKWVDHLEHYGFRVEAHDVRDLGPIKNKYGISRALESCHTAEVDGYIVEGHVPADLIERMLRERPAVAGIAVPGMPMGSPGMEGPYRERYDVLAFDRDGKTEVYDRR